MRRFALLLAGGALWLILAASAAYADGGPHTLTVNNGTSGLSGDCAACHRAHTAQAASLLKSSMPGLCLTCHNGTGATTDVVDGYQFTPDGSGNPTGQILGALRGGGFDYALIDTSTASVSNPNGASRLSYSSRGGITLTFGAAPTSSANNMTLTWAPFGTFGGGALTFNAADTAANVQITADALFGASAAYTGSTSLVNMSGLPAGGSNVVVTKSGNNFTFAPHNSLRLATMPVPSVTTNGSGTTATMTNGISVGNTSHVGVLAAGQAVTSTHEGLGTVWGNGPQGQGNAGPAGVALECTSCHNPHGNGQYRILQTLPGADLAQTTTLSGAIASTSATSIGVASAAAFPASGAYEIKIDSEQMRVTAGQGTLTWTVTRGINGTTAATHASGATVANNFTTPTNAVEVVDGATLTAGQVRNYTVKPGSLTTDVVPGYTVGDYWRYKYDPTGAVNFTNFYLLKDPMNSGWNGQTPTNAATIAAVIAAVPSLSLTATLPATGSSTATTSATVASTTGLPTHAPSTEPQPLFIVKIDSEFMTASVTNGTTLKVARGFNGTTVATHLSGAVVTVISSDPGVDPTNASLYNGLGRMTAFCIACHTRYNGWAQNGTSSLYAQTPSDALYGFKHGTTSVGCEQCHVNHGSNAAMSGQFTSKVTFPGGSVVEDSALFKVDNRGTCQLCHDPTGTVPAGTTIGTIPGSISPGP